MRIGFIGTGSMGGMLIGAFARAQEPEGIQITACNRSPEKLQHLIQKYPDVNVGHDPVEISLTSDVIFLCVRPNDAIPVLQQIRGDLTRRQYLISINSAVPLATMEAMLPCKVMKIIPSITQAALAGVVLTIPGTRMTSEDCERLDGLLGRIGRPVKVSEDNTRICSDLTSCGPAFLAWIIQEWTRAAVRQGDISHGLAEEMLKETMYGLAKLVTEYGFSFEDVKQRVAVPGGITETGLCCLENTLTGAFDLLLQTTHAKQNDHLHTTKK